MKTVRRILLLGNGETGKSTFLKQVKIIQNIALMPAFQLNTQESIIKTNIIAACRLILPPLTKALGDAKPAEFQETLEFINDGDDIDNPDWKIHLKTFSEIKEVHQIIEKRMEYELQFPIDLKYFFPRVSEVWGGDYVPSPDDLLRTRQLTTGVHEFEFIPDNGNTVIHFIDVGGQPAERRKWIHQFDSVDQVLFFSALDSYCLKAPPGHPYTYRLEEELHIWSTLRQQIPLHIPFVFIQNKSDIFQDILPMCPLNKYFPDVPASKGTNYEYCLGYLKQLFSAKFQGERTLHFFVSNALDKNLTETIWNQMRSDIVKSVFDKVTM